MYRNTYFLFAEINGSLSGYIDWEAVYGKNVTIEKQFYLTLLLPKCLDVMV